MFTFEIIMYPCVHVLGNSPLATLTLIFDLYLPGIPAQFFSYNYQNWHLSIFAGKKTEQRERCSTHNRAPLPNQPTPTIFPLHPNLPLIPCQVMIHTTPCHFTAPRTSGGNFPLRCTKTISLHSPCYYFSISVTRTVHHNPVILPPQGGYKTYGIIV